MKKLDLKFIFQVVAVLVSVAIVLAVIKLSPEGKIANEEPVSLWGFLITTIILAGILWFWSRRYTKCAVCKDKRKGKKEWSFLTGFYHPECVIKAQNSVI